MAVGVYSGGLISNDKMTSSSVKSGTASYYGRLRNNFANGWSPADDDDDPWLRIDMIFEYIIYKFDTEVS